MDTREIVLDILLELEREQEYVNILLADVLKKYDYLDGREKAFIKRVSEGTVERRIQIDHVLDLYSKVKTQKMKPLIRALLRMSVYQILFMEHIPDAAVCNEAVKLAVMKGFQNLKGFVNGVLRSVARNMDKVVYPQAESQPLEYLSITYSMPEWILKEWLEVYDFDTVEKICLDTHQEKMTSVRCNLDKASKEEIVESLKAQGITVKENPYLKYALDIGGYNYIKAVEAFKKGWLQVQDVSSMLAAEIAAPGWGSYCIDVCAAPGGKSLHLADMLRGSGYVEARDVTDYKVKLMQENIERIGNINMSAVLMDATVFDAESVEKADILIADVPCSGLGVMGKKADIKYKMTPAKQTEIVKLQRKILDTVQAYVKKGGVLIYSTCTIAAAENQYNVKWFLENYPFRLESIEPYLCDELKGKTTKAGYLQLLPGVNESDGFFIARLKRID